MGERSAVVFDERRMAGHSEVGLHICSRFALRIKKMEGEVVWCVRGECFRSSHCIA